MGHTTEDDEGEDAGLPPDDGSQDPPEIHEKEPRYAAFTDDDRDGIEPYSIMRDLIAKHHATALCDAKIALMWDLKPVPEDACKRFAWGKAILVSEREREFHDHDFIVILHKQVWEKMSRAQREALMDHELCHCGADVGDTRTRYFIEKHDLEEFVEVVKRHGLWAPEVEQLVRAAATHDIESIDSIASTSLFGRAPAA